MPSFGCFACVDQDEVGVIESFGKFVRLARPGLSPINICCGECLTGSVNTRVRQLDVRCETKTKDNVFVDVTVSVQYEALATNEDVYNAYVLSPEEGRVCGRDATCGLTNSCLGSKTQVLQGAFAVCLQISIQHSQKLTLNESQLTNTTEQITAFVFDVVRSAVPKIELDNVFDSKDEIADAVKTELSQTMPQFGYLIRNTLVTDIKYASPTCLLSPLLSTAIC